MAAWTASYSAGRSVALRVPTLADMKASLKALPRVVQKACWSAAVLVYWTAALTVVLLVLTLAARWGTRMAVLKVGQ